MAKVLILDVLNGKGLYEAECNELADYYMHLQCDCFDIAHYRVGDKCFDMFVDDIGLFKERRIVSMVDNAGNPMLVNNIVFANHDAEGNTTSLTDDDIALIKRNVMHVVDFDADPVEEWEVILANY